jgi:hypothetical protein
MRLDSNSNTASFTLEQLLAALDSPALDEAPSQARPADGAGPADDDTRGTFDRMPFTLSAQQLAAVAPRSAPAADSAAAAARQQQARQLAEGGGLQSPAVQPPPSQQELDALAARLGAAGDAEAVRIANDPRALAIATPQQKAALARKLMDGHTNGDEEQALEKLLLSCTSRDEMDQVIQMCGGIEAIADELDGDALQRIGAHATQLTQRQDAAVAQALDLLDRPQTRQEFEQLYHQLGGEQLKHKLPQPPNAEMLQRLDALGAKHGVAGVGFGMPAEKTSALQAQIQQAIDADDSDAIVKLAENGDALKAASPAQKARMIAVLQDGWTKDSQDMAIARILTSCASKAEFDRVVDMAGGPKILDDIDLPEAKADINKLMGGFDRIDCADDKATAQAYRGVLLPPQVDALSAARNPSEAERDAVLGPRPPGARDDERIDQVRDRMSEAAHDVQADPLARNKLALVNRDRQLNGQPPLDHTALVSRAYEVANDPAFLAEAERAIAGAEKQRGKLDDAERQEIREQVLAQRLGAVAKEYGLSEQAMKTLVTAKMGRVLQEGAGALRSLGDDPATRAWADRLQATGVTAANLFKVPPSFAEDFVAALSVIGDALAAVVNLIPGVGQAISGAYFGVKAIVGLANGDLLGAFKSLLSAVPGFSGVFGAASAAINAGARVAQAGIAAGETIASGNPLAIAGALGGVAGQLGIDLRSIGAGAVADQLDAIGRSPAANAFRQTVDHAAPFVAAIGSGDPAAAGDALRRWIPQLAAHAPSQAIVGLAQQAEQLLGSRALDRDDAATQHAKRLLEQLSALHDRAADVRRFEDAALALGPLGRAGWHAVGAALIAQLGVR